MGESASAYGMAGGPAGYQPDKDAEKVLAETLTVAYGESKPDGLRALVHAGNAAKVLIDAAKNAEMLVVGSRGRGGFVGLLLGSVSKSVAEHAECSVVVVRDPADKN
ncbi:universal stress protein [Rhodococcus sp. H29-C3]|uniref:universal stress protein n=1 Tax=Rhodococcus sp. H29-C3 TaxID=3046307 RepID=UPI0024B930D8|nr:universal stress protein [Rhodococcus sp. H29-C3]MDJ0360660.1 universal stress protein [Rhodococcus sp. H29-C3]